MSFDPHEYLRHIVAEADYLRQQTAQISKEEFLKSDTLRQAPRCDRDRIAPGCPGASRALPRDHGAG